MASKFVLSFLSAISAFACLAYNYIFCFYNNYYLILFFNFEYFFL